MATGIEIADETIDAVTEWKKTGKNKPAAIVFKIHSKKGWLVDKYSDPKKSVEAQFDEIKGSFTEGQSRVWIMKVQYEKDGSDKEDLVYLLRRGQPISRKAKSLIFSYAAGGSVVKDLVGNIKANIEYEHKDVKYDDVAKRLATRV